VPDAEVLFVPVDAGDAGQVGAAVTAVHDRFGQIDVAVSSVAGSYRPELLHRTWLSGNPRRTPGSPRSTRRASVAEVRVHPTLQFLPVDQALDVLGDAGGEERLGHLFGIGRVRGDQAVGQVPQRMTFWQRLRVGHV